MDDARKWTDKELKKITKDLTKTYRKASKEVTEKWMNYMSESAKNIEKYQVAYNEAKRSKNKDAIKSAEQELMRAKRNQTFQNDRYKSLTDAFAKNLASVNQQALNYINNKTPEIYAVNYNQVSDMVKNIDISFTLINKDAVKRRILDGDIKLPKKKINIPKDMRWNTKQLNSQVLQGILQGESMQKIAKRILPIVDGNKNAAIRNARTMVTGAENEGRLDSFKRLEEEGLVVKKVWIATNDERTREWHADLDGVEVDIDEPFVDGNGNELDYPGDPSAEPETVYNCRCSMKTHILGIKNQFGSIDYF